jgi:hypothetical protein
MAGAGNREVLEGVQYQGEDEIIVYTLDTSAIGDPSSPMVVVKDEYGDDVTAAVMPVIAPTASGGVVQLSPLKSLQPGRRYRVEVRYEAVGNTLESYFYVQGQV